jgi:transposase InsO family protein
MWTQRRQARAIEYLQGENRILRERLGQKRLRFSDAERRRLGELGRDVGRRVLARVACIATPDTILRWHRELVVARKYDGSRKRHPCRRSRPDEIARLIVDMARRNVTWGYTRLRGALKNLGHEIGRNTIKRVLAQEGIDPAPTRRTRYSWATFIKAHLGVIAAADFFTVEALGLLGLVRFHVFFVMDIATRKVTIAGITRNPDGSWMAQAARSLLNSRSGFLRGKRYLLLDRDPVYSSDFRCMLERSGTRVVRLPARSPNLNAFAERFVLSIRNECLNRIVPLGERHLRHVIAEFVEHYHLERNHQGLGNELIERASVHDRGRIVRRERLGGLLSYYHRKAA